MDQVDVPYMYINAKDVKNVVIWLMQHFMLMSTLDGNTKTLLPVSELPCILSLIQ